MTFIGFKTGRRVLPSSCQRPKALLVQYLVSKLGKMLEPALDIRSSACYDVYYYLTTRSWYHYDEVPNLLLSR